MEKGILGIKKDPKNQMLFSFVVRSGDEWPSDSDDSDYSPTADEGLICLKYLTVCICCVDVGF